MKNEKVRELENTKRSKMNFKEFFKKRILEIKSPWIGVLAMRVLPGAPPVGGHPP